MKRSAPVLIALCLVFAPACAGLLAAEEASRPRIEPAWESSSSPVVVTEPFE